MGYVIVRNRASENIPTVSWSLSLDKPANSLDAFLRPQITSDYQWTGAELRTLCGRTIFIELCVDVLHFVRSLLGVVALHPMNRFCSLKDHCRLAFL